MDGRDPGPGKNISWPPGEFKVLNSRTYQPNYCYDCNLPFFGWVCYYCGGENNAVELL